MFKSELICFERRAGFILRHVQEVDPSTAVVHYLETSMSDIPVKERPFTALEEGNKVYLVDTVGALIVGKTVVNGLVDVHIIFWDRTLNGREILCNVMAEVAAARAGCRGVWTAIPETSRTTLAFAKRVGFNEVTRMGNSVVLDMLFT